MPLRITQNDIRKRLQNTSPFQNIVIGQITSLMKDQGRIKVHLLSSHSHTVEIMHPFMSTNGWHRICPEVGSYVLLCARNETKQDFRILSYLTQDEAINIAFAINENYQREDQFVQLPFISKTNTTAIGKKLIKMKKSYKPYRLLDETEQEAVTRGDSAWFMGNRGRMSLHSGPISIWADRDDLDAGIRTMTYRQEFTENYPGSMEDMRLSGVVTRPLDKDDKRNGWRTWITKKSGGEDQFCKEDYFHLKWKGWPKSLYSKHVGHIRNLKGKPIKMTNYPELELRGYEYFWTDYVQEPENRKEDQAWTDDNLIDKYKDEFDYDSNELVWQKNPESGAFAGKKFWKRYNEDVIPKDEGGGGKFGTEHSIYGDIFQYQPAHTKMAFGYRHDIPTGNYQINVAYKYWDEWQRGGNFIRNIAQDDNTWVGKNRNEVVQKHRYTWIGDVDEKTIHGVEVKNVGPIDPIYLPKCPKTVSCTKSESKEDQPSYTEELKKQNNSNNSNNSNSSTDGVNNCCGGGGTCNPSPSKDNASECFTNGLCSGSSGQCSQNDIKHLSSGITDVMSNILSKMPENLLVNITGENLAKTITDKLGNTKDEIAKNIAIASNINNPIEKINDKIEQIKKELTTIEQINNGKSCAGAIKNMVNSQCCGLNNSQCQSLAKSCGNSKACPGNSQKDCQQPPCNKGSCSNGGCAGKPDEKQEKESTFNEKEKCQGRQLQCVSGKGLWTMKATDIYHETDTYDILCKKSYHLKSEGTILIEAADTIKLKAPGGIFLN